MNSDLKNIAGTLCLVNGVQGRKAALKIGMRVTLELLPADEQAASGQSLKRHVTCWRLSSSSSLQSCDQGAARVPNENEAAAGAGGEETVVAVGEGRKEVGVAAEVSAGLRHVCLM
jgi:hypothetical protein